MPARLPGRRRHRPVHQRHRRLPAGELHRLPVLRVGMPVRHPEVQPTTKKVYKCTLCSDRVGQGLEPACIKSCPTGCLKFGTKTDMRALAETRARQLREHSGFPNAGVYDPPSVGGTHVIYVLHDITKPELYGGLPVEPADSGDLHGVEAVREADRPAAGAVGRAGGVLPLHHGRAEGAAAAPEGAMTRRSARAGRGNDPVRENELLRHPVYTRVVHWSSAIFFVLALLSGFAIYSAVAVSLADAALRRRPDDATAPSVVQPGIRRRLRAADSELVGADGVDERRPPVAEALSGRT